MKCLNHFVLLLLLVLAATWAAHAKPDACSANKGTCRPRACCRDEHNRERAIALVGVCQRDEICCSSEVKVKPCMEGKGSCLPLGCCPNDKDTIAIVERTGECGSFAICCLYEAAAAAAAPAAVKSTCSFMESEPMCGTRETGITESTDIRANRWEFPWSVAIFEIRSMASWTFNVFLCGGSVLQDGTIVTTAECVEKQRANVLRVHLGRWNLVAPGREECSQLLSVTKIVLHGGYNPATKENNIALLLTGGIVQWSTSVNHICLPTAERSDTDPCYIVGWDSESTGSVNYMLKFSVRTDETLDECRDSVREHHPSSAYVLSLEHGCASVVDTMDKHYPCARITGSGVVCRSSATGRYYLRGIALYALRNCSLSTINDLFVDVTRYLDWIRDTPRGE
ncbi:chymotrypsin-like elastase family member 2A [Anopheles albimanus]|uniref:Uncharacterized protein n=1 Tax=Anopheles albimanus TaxID=7167 RepID=A0A182FW32_ANOAL|nr:chymotrypsin-like elastase family member 2A [Anopheles albimanus]